MAQIPASYKVEMAKLTSKSTADVDIGFVKHKKRLLESYKSSTEINSKSNDFHLDLKKNQPSKNKLYRNIEPSTSFELPVVGENKSLSDNSGSSRYDGISLDSNHVSSFSQMMDDKEKIDKNRVDYEMIIHSIFHNNWVIPSSVDTSISCVVEVSISRSGLILDYQFSGTCNDVKMRRSIIKAMDSVRMIKAPHKDVYRKTEFISFSLE
ncbi:TonB C-terminal domain-containing protein [Photobacterium leiognathi]|uniref:TonB C-terminal domain-containing protein n=1 Tax=Photobacterium leiognathi TaxID=553611 RepID=UPI0029826825|nr:TonB C-terminal domain-containing protein [Photobacterium leiognathi]